MKHRKVTYKLSEEAVRALAGIAKNWGLSSTASVESLIRREAGLPPFGHRAPEISRLSAVEDRSPQITFVEAEPETIETSAESPEALAAAKAVVNLMPTPAPAPEPVVREVDGSLGPVPDVIQEIVSRVVGGEDVAPEEMARVQRWRRGHDD